MQPSLSQQLYGYYHFLQQCFPPKPTWGVDNIPDLSGKVYLVTGSNVGIGYECVKALLSKNAKVYMACRNMDKARAAKDRLQKETGKEAELLQLDLADLKAVKKAVVEFLSREIRLDVLINNGGVMSCPVDQLTADGYDMAFGTNVLGHFYLTQLLLPLLIESAKDSPDNKARVVTLSSSAHESGYLDLETIKPSKARTEMANLPLRSEMFYFQSKLGDAIFARELARRYGDKGIVSTGLNPGHIMTDIFSKSEGFARFLLYASCRYTPTQGALTQLYAATAPEAAGLNGKYLIPWARLGPTAKIVQDPEVGRILWEWCEEQIKGLSP